MLKIYGKHHTALSVQNLKLNYTMMTAIDFFSYGAAICMILGYVPQAWRTIRTRDTDGIAMTTFVMMGLGSAFFVVLGFLTHVWALWVTNIITLLSSVVIFGIKIYNDYFSPRAKERRKAKK